MSLYDGPAPPAISYDSSSSSKYAPTSDYVQLGPLQHPVTVVTHGLQVNTPPPTLDDSVITGSSDSASMHWRSPPARRPTRAKSRSTRDSRARRRHVAKERPDLPGPLSELTKHMVHIPVKEMATWVHRSIEVRHQEVAKKNGKVARPMNSFILYRFAYAERTKQWISQNNHQEVSAAAGISWKLEPPEVREKYKLFANIEKKNHVKAHPGYRFSPSKDKKKRPVSADGHHPSMPSQNTPESSPDLGHHARDLSYSEVDGGWDNRDSTPFSFIEHGLPTGAYLGSSWQSANPSRPAPGLMSPESTPYVQQTSIHQNIWDSHVEDVRFEQVDMQEVQYSSTALAGLPGASHHDLLQPPTTVSASGRAEVDPQLLSFVSEGGIPGSRVYSNPYYPVWQVTPSSNAHPPVGTSMAQTTVSYPVEWSYQPGMQTLIDSRDAWQSSPETPVGEFDHWLNLQASEGY